MLTLHPLAAVQTGIGRCQRIDRCHHIAILVIATVGGGQWIRLARAVGAAVGLHGSQQARVWRGNTGGRALVIGLLGTLPDMATGIVNLAVRNRIDRIIVPAVQALIVGHIRPFFGQRIDVGRQIAAGGDSLDQIIVSRRAKCRAGPTQIVIGIFDIDPGMGGIAFVKGRFRFQGRLQARRIDSAYRPRREKGPTR